MNTISNNINNSVNFGAKLNVMELKSPRWKNIAKEFESKTPKEAYSMDLYKSEGKVNFYTVNDEDNFFTNQIELSDNGTKQFLKLSDDNIVKKLINILGIAKKELTTKMSANDYLDKFSEKFNIDDVINKNADVDGDYQDLTDAMMNIIDKKIKVERKPLIKNDEILNDANFND